MPDMPLLLPTLADIGRHGPTSDDVESSKWRRHKPEVKMTFERKSMATRFQRLCHIFYHTQLIYSTAYNDRHRPTSGTQNVGYETGSGKNL